MYTLQDTLFICYEVFNNEHSITFSQHTSSTFLIDYEDEQEELDSLRRGKLDLSTASHTLDYKAVEIIAQCCPNLEHINLSSVKVTNVSLQQLAIKCPKLKNVILQRCFEVGEKGLVLDLTVLKMRKERFIFLVLNILM
ncbi:RNA-binding protein EEED8.10 [Trichonephila clavipes]|nr:RNA-binding protein EEED8.10 [Trichonephila clavipes]